MARPTDCTDAVIQEFTSAIKDGLYFEDAAVIAGIAVSTGYKWLERGENGEEPFVRFAEAYKLAEAQAQREALREIRQAQGGKDSIPWQSRAWFLERRWFRKFGRTVQEIEHSGTVQTVKVELPAGATIDQLRAMAGKQGE